MGMEIAQQRGLAAFGIWAVANALALAIFGALYHRGALKAGVLSSRWVRISGAIIQGFSLIIQLNIINKILLSLTGNSVVSYLMTSLIGGAFVLLVYDKGLRISIGTDVMQWMFAMACMVVIVAIGLIADVPLAHFEHSTGGDISWALWSACILVSGVIGDVQHWQRAEKDNTGRAYYIAAGLFACYLLLVLAMAQFEFNAAMNIVLLAAVLGVTTSTIDSIAVALQEVVGKRIGSSIAFAMCFLWGLFVQWGVMNIWTRFGAFRVAFAVLILAAPYIGRLNRGDQKRKAV